MKTPPSSLRGELFDKNYNPFSSIGLERFLNNSLRDQSYAQTLRRVFAHRVEKFFFIASRTAFFGQTGAPPRAKPHHSVARPPAVNYLVLGLKDAAGTCVGRGLDGLSGVQGQRVIAKSIQHRQGLLARLFGPACGHGRGTTSGGARARWCTLRRRMIRLRSVHPETDAPVASGSAAWASVPVVGPEAERSQAWRRGTYRTPQPAGSVLQPPVISPRRAGLIAPSRSEVPLLIAQPRNGPMVIGQRTIGPPAIGPPLIGRIGPSEPPPASSSSPPTPRAPVAAP